MEQVLIKAAQLILSLSILVILHEFGHYLFARLFKTRVEKFYLFFDPWFSLFKKKVGETEYGVGWLPLGGYVKISGMIDESMDTEAMQSPPQPWEFRSKKPYQRLLIMIGGVLMNFLFAFIIYIGIIYAWGTAYLPTDKVRYGIMVSEAGEEIGLRNGDKILSVDGQYIEDFYKIIPTILLDGVETVQVQRGNETVSLNITGKHLAALIKAPDVIQPRRPFDISVARVMKESPAMEAGLQEGDVITKVDEQTFEFYDQFAGYLKSKKGQNVNLEVQRNNEPVTLPVVVGQDGLLGFNFRFSESASAFLEYKTVSYSFLESIPEGVRHGINTMGNYLKQFRLIFSPETKAYQSLGGFITIGNIFPGAWDWYAFWNMTALLSIILGIMNLLPIPALDGGHVMFLLFEMITGRKPGDKFMEYAQITGMIIIFALVFYANANDVINLFR